MSATEFQRTQVAFSSNPDVEHLALLRAGIVVSMRKAQDEAPGSRHFVVLHVRCSAAAAQHRPARALAQVDECMPAEQIIEHRPPDLRIFPPPGSVKSG